MRITTSDEWNARRAALLDALREFARIMRRRPFDNEQGLRGVSAFALYWFVRELAPAYAVPMHYRTPAVDFLEPADAFLALFDDVEPTDVPEWTVPAERPPATRVVVLQAPEA